MGFSGLSTVRKERAARAMRRRWKLAVPKVAEKVPEAIPAPVPVLPANHCQGDRSCPFPPLFAGRCRQHARDEIARGSSVGTAHAVLREYGLVDQPEARNRRTGWGGT